MVAPVFRSKLGSDALELLRKAVFAGNAVITVSYTHLDVYKRQVEDVAALLQSTFHGGNGFKTPEGEISAWYAVDLSLIHI